MIPTFINKLNCASYRFAVAFLAFHATYPALAYNFQCSKFQNYRKAIERPVAPTCVDDLIVPYGNDFLLEFKAQADDCRSQIESYRYELNNYLSCLKSESDDAVSSFNDLVNSFNQKARGY